MQKQAMPRTSKEWVDEMLRDHYRDARQAKRGRASGVLEHLHCAPRNC